MKDFFELCFESKLYTAHGDVQISFDRNEPEYFIIEIVHSDIAFDIT